MKLSLTPVFIHLVDFSSRASKYLVGQVILVPWKHWLPRIESATLLNFALKFKRKWFDTLVFANKTKIFAWEEETQSALPKPPRHKAVAITESAWYLHVVERFHNRKENRVGMRGREGRGRTREVNRQWMHTFWGQFHNAKRRIVSPVFKWPSFEWRSMAAWAGARGGRGEESSSVSLIQSLFLYFRSRRLTNVGVAHKYAHTEHWFYHLMLRESACDAKM